MVITVNTVQDCCEDVEVICTPAEWLILNKALRLLSENRNVSEVDRREAAKMHAVQPAFCERQKHER